MRWRRGLDADRPDDAERARSPERPDGSFRADAAFRPPAEEVGRLRKALYAEAALFAFIPLCAAAMARGYGT